MRPAALALLFVLTALPVAAAAPQTAEIGRLQGGQDEDKGEGGGTHQSR